MWSFGKLSRAIETLLFSQHKHGRKKRKQETRERVYKSKKHSLSFQGVKESLQTIPPFFQDHENPCVRGEKCIVGITAVMGASVRVALAAERERERITCLVLTVSTVTWEKRRFGRTASPEQMHQMCTMLRWFVGLNNVSVLNVRLMKCNTKQWLL